MGVLSKIFSISILIFVILIYFIGVNFIHQVMMVSSQFSSTNGNNLDNSQGFDIDLGTSDSVSVSIVRNRWYGQINEYSSSNSNNIQLKLFGIITIPLRLNDFHYLGIHIFFVLGIIIIYILKSL